MEPLRSLAAVRSCPLSAACAALRSLSFSLSVSPRTLVLSFPSCFCSLLILDSSFQEFVPGYLFPPVQAAHSFLSLSATRCHSENQVRGDEGHFAPQPLDWSCCVGFRCLHRTIQGLKSNRRMSAIHSSWDPLNCLQQRESVPTWRRDAARVRGLCSSGAGLLHRLRSASLTSVSPFTGAPCSRHSSQRSIPFLCVPSEHVEHLQSAVDCVSQMAHLPF